MDSDQLLAAIITHGLSIRQIPLTVVSLYEMRHYTEGQEIVDCPLPTPRGYTYESQKAFLTRNACDPRNYTFDDEAKTVVARLQLLDLAQVDHRLRTGVKVSGHQVS